MGGQARDRTCLSCENRPLITGNGWYQHCKTKHKGENKNEIKY